MLHGIKMRISRGCIPRPAPIKRLAVLARSARCALEAGQPLRLRAGVAVRLGDPVGTQVIALLHGPAVDRPDALGNVPRQIVPGDVVPLHRVGVALVLAVCKVDLRLHPQQIDPVVGIRRCQRLGRRRRIRRDLAQRQQKDLVEDLPLNLIEPVQQDRVVDLRRDRLELAQPLKQYRRCHVSPPSPAAACPGSRAAAPACRPSSSRRPRSRLLSARPC